MRTIKRLTEWAQQVPKSDFHPLTTDKLDILVWTWAFALATDGAKEFTGGFSWAAVKYLGGSMVTGFFLWAVYSAVIMTSRMRKNNLFRLGYILVVLILLTYVAKFLYA